MYRVKGKMQPKKKIRVFHLMSVNQQLPIPSASFAFISKLCFIYLILFVCSSEPIWKWFLLFEEVYSGFTQNVFHKTMFEHIVHILGSQINRELKVWLGYYEEISAMLPFYKLEEL